MQDYEKCVEELHDLCVVSDGNQIFEYLRESNIGVNLHYIPIHLQPYYKKMGFKKNQFPEAEKYYSEAISLPIYPALSELEQNYIINKVKDALEK